MSEPQTPSGSQTPPPAAAWRTADITSLTGRLAAARSLLEQAAALAVAQDTARVTNMTHLQEQLGKERDGHQGGRRKYR